MGECIATFLIGVLCIVLGFAHRRGHISSLHSYHRKRVAKEDILPFGKMVGLGTIIIGSGVVALSVLLAITLYTERDLFAIIGTAIVIVCLVVGLAISFKAMIRYNKGIF